MLLTTQHALAYTLPPIILRGSDPGVCGATTGTGTVGLMASVLATAVVGLDGVDGVESIFFFNTRSIYAKYF